MIQDLAKISPETEALSRHIAAAHRRRLPAGVVAKAKQHVLDTFAAMVSGSRLVPGQHAIGYVATLGGVREAGVVGSPIVTNAANAALANGMLAHADETDDSHVPSHTHPGSAVVPAALAAAEKTHAGGTAFLRAVVLGYDVGCRLMKALDVQAFIAEHRSPHSFGGTFGAAAAGALLGVDPTQARFLLSYCAQLASGCSSNVRDSEHIEKSFDFAGMPAHAGVLAATMVASGFTGVDDVFSGERNFLDAYGPRPHPQALAEGLGRHYEIMDTNIKRWTVGSPMQSALDSLEWLIRTKGVTAEDVQHVAVHLPTRSSRTVDDAAMPNINAQHLVGLMLIDGTVSFASSHDMARMGDPTLMALRRRVRVVPRDDFIRGQAIVEIATRHGQTHARHTRAVRGTVANPMTWEAVVEKARGLMDPILGKRKARAVVNAVSKLETLNDVTRLRPLLAVRASRGAAT